MTKPAVHFRHAASGSDGTDDRTLLIVFASGKGCLVSLRTWGDTDIIDVYNADDGIFVMRPDKCDPQLLKEKNNGNA